MIDAKSKPMKLWQLPRARTYIATMHSEHGEQYTFIFKSSGKNSAWRMALAEADARFMSLHTVKHAASVIKFY
jgi:hypothetical protein